MHACVLSGFRCLRLCVTPWTVTHQGPRSMGFSRQECWSGLPCPPLGNLPTQGLNPGLPHCRSILYHLSHQGRAHLPVQTTMRNGLDPWVRTLPWRRAWQPTPAFWPGESHGQKSLAGYSPWGCRELDTTERLSLHFTYPGRRGRQIWWTATNTSHDVPPQEVVTKEAD